MKIVTFFTTIVAAVLFGFGFFYVNKHKTVTRDQYLHVFLLSRNDDDFHLMVDSIVFNSDLAEQGDMGLYSYVGKIAKNGDSADIVFKSQNIDTTFTMAVVGIDSIAIGAQGDGQLLLKKL